jgi:hypothetical protein
MENGGQSGGSEQIMCSPTGMKDSRIPRTYGFLELKWFIFVSYLFCILTLHLSNEISISENTLRNLKISDLLLPLK